MISVLFSIRGPRLTPDESSEFADHAHWVVLAQRNDRLLVDSMCLPGYVRQAHAALNAMDRDPQVIGAWHQDGTPVAGYVLDEAAWLEVAPDDYDAADPETPIRPTAFRDLHRWAGWGDKVY